MTPPVRALTIVLAALLLLGGATTPASAQKPKIRVWLLRTYVPDANRALEDSIKRWAVSKNLDPVIEYFTFDDIETKYVAPIEANALPDGAQLRPLGQSWNRSADGYGVFQALLYSYGGGWADEQGNYKSIVNDTWRTVVRWASEIYLTDKTVPPDAMSWTGFGNNEAFLTGKIAFTFNGPSIYYVLEKENRPILKDTVMAVNPPGPAGRDHHRFLPSWTGFSPNKTPALARDLLRFLMSSHAARKYMHAPPRQMGPPF